LGGTFERFQVNWNGTTLMTLLNPPVMTWTNFLFPVTATGTSSLLLFGEEDNVDYFGLDDVSVMPLPLTLKSAVITANSLNLTWIVATGLVYQVQYQTNLLQTNWVNLGNAITATITNLAVTDTNALINSSQRFYRLQVSP
jgi:hypothetical protein